MNKIKRLSFYFFGFFHDVFFSIVYVIRSFFYNDIYIDGIDSSGHFYVEGFDLLEKQFLDSKIQILSQEYVNFDGNWSKDPYSGYQWKNNWHKISNRDRPKGADIKIPWEIGRLQHLTSLALNTSSAAVQEKIIFDISRFINTNTPYFGVQWACPMDVSIRSINLTLIVSKLNISNCLSRSKLNLYLLEQYRYIRKYNERNGDLRNNHYFTNLLGQLVLCHFFKTRIGSSNYNDDIDRIVDDFFEELDFQFFDNCFNFEGSANYHRLSTEIVFWFYLYAKELNILTNDRDLHLKYKLSRMIEHLKCLSNGIGLTNIGDTDSGMIIDLNYNFIQDENYHFYKDLSRNGLFLLEIDHENLESYELSKIFESTDIFQNSFSEPNVVSIKKFDVNKSRWRLPIDDLSIVDKYVNLELGVIKLTFSNGWLLIKTKGTANTGHCHLDFLRVECFFDSCFYSIFPGTESYSGSSDERNFNRAGIYGYKMNPSLSKFTNLSTSVLDKESQIIFHEENITLIYDGDFLKVSFDEDGIFIESNTIPFLYPSRVWSGYGFECGIKYI